MSNCLICQSATEQWMDSQIKIAKEFVVYHTCKHCGFTSKARRFFIDQAAEKRQYDTHQNSLENEGYVTMLNNFIDTAVMPFIKSGNALDYGSGPEPVLQSLLRQRGFDVAIYDPYYANDQNVFVKDYDLITSTEVFEHFYSPLNAIERIVKRLKKAGYIAIMTQFKPNDQATFLQWWYRRDATHVSFYTLDSFRIIEEKFGLIRRYTNHKNLLVLQKR